jgi:hypothetical protein
MHKQMPAKAILATLIAAAIVATVFLVTWVFVNQLG